MLSDPSELRSQGVKYFGRNDCDREYFTPQRQCIQPQSEVVHTNAAVSPALIEQSKGICQIITRGIGAIVSNVPQELFIVFTHYVAPQVEVSFLGSRPLTGRLKLAGRDGSRCPTCRGDLCRVPDMKKTGRLTWGISDDQRTDGGRDRAPGEIKWIPDQLPEWKVLQRDTRFQLALAGGPRFARARKHYSRCLMSHRLTYVDCIEIEHRAEYKFRYRRGAGFYDSPQEAVLHSRAKQLVH